MAEDARLIDRPDRPVVPKGEGRDIPFAVEPRFAIRLCDEGRRGRGDVVRRGRGGMTHSDRVLKGTGKKGDRHLEDSEPVPLCTSTCEYGGAIRATCGV